MYKQAIAMSTKSHKLSQLGKNVLSVFVTTRCQANCDHCLCVGQDIPDISTSDCPPIISAIDSLNIKTIRLTGGEPTLCMESVGVLLKEVLNIHPHVALELSTNAHFAKSHESCERVLGSIPNIRAVAVSYDRFHERYVDNHSIKLLIESCRKLNIEVTGFASIASPHDLCDVLDYENDFGIPFKYQQVIPIGNALKKDIRFPYKVFEVGVLDQVCPQSSSLIYIPSYGFTSCCSSLFFKSNKITRTLLANMNAELFLKSEFYRTVTSYTFGNLAARLDDGSAFVPDDSCPCELCYKILPRIIRPLTGSNQARSII